MADREFKQIAHNRLAVNICTFVVFDYLTTAIVGFFLHSETSA